MRTLLISIITLLLAAPVAAQTAVVVEVRGIDLKVGSRLEEGRPVKLPAGGKLVVVRNDGTVISLRGPYDGPVRSKAAPSRGAGRALAALVATRNDRANRVGAVRSGSNAAPVPSPWLIDITRPGERCLIEGAPIGWWRPTTVVTEDFTLSPLDRSWNTQFRFETGQDIVSITRVSDIDGTKTFIVKDDEREYSIRLHLIPAAVTEPAILAAWMIEKGCIQQADAMLALLPTDETSESGE
ncbi:MAG: hypothetical protein NXH71_08395 [Erythrobacteraceae bacterium]|jgi:hypothetical protein|nr:hypothetical protein [Erythrobacteraceae bacterium]